MNRKSEQDHQSNWNIRPYLATGLAVLLVILISISFYFIILRYNGVSATWNKAKAIVQPIIFGIVFAYLINPIVNGSEKLLNRFVHYNFKTEKKKKKVFRGISVAVSMLIVFFVIGLLLKMILPQIYISVEGLIKNLPDQVNGAVKTVQKYLSTDSRLSVVVTSFMTNGTDFLDKWVKNDILPQAEDLLTQVTTGVYIAVKVLFNAIIGLIVCVYLLLDKEKFLSMSKKTVYAVFRPKAANILVDTLRRSHEIFIGFLSGMILDSCIIGCLVFIILSIVGVPYALLISVIVGCTNVIPFFGPYIGAIPSFLIILLEDPMKSLYFLIIVLVLQQIDGNLIAPRILGNSTGLSPFWVVFAIMIGGGFFGFIGLLIGVPLFAVIYQIVGRILRFLLRRKKLPQETALYEQVDHIDESNNQLVFQEQKPVMAPKKKSADKGSNT